MHCSLRTPPCTSSSMRLGWQSHLLPGKASLSVHRPRPCHCLTLHNGLPCSMAIGLAPIFRCTSSRSPPPYRHRRGRLSHMPPCSVPPRLILASACYKKRPLCLHKVSPKLCKSS